MRKNSLFIALSLMLSVSTYGQNMNQEDSTKEHLISVAREIIKDAGHCVLITLDSVSNPMARLMDPFPLENDFTIWFGTNAKSRKVKQIQNNPTVTIYFQDIDVSGYVVMHGNAEIIDHPKEKEKRWKEEWEAFYPNNKEGYLLIKVSPKWMEILSVSRGIAGDPKTWKTPVVKFD